MEENNGPETLGVGLSYRNSKIKNQYTGIGNIQEGRET